MKLQKGILQLWFKLVRSKENRTTNCLVMLRKIHVDNVNRHD